MVKSMVCAMSAWNPTVWGRSTISSSCTLWRQLCMPAQQISPSAASRSPKLSAMEAASRKVWAMRLVPAAGSLAQSAGLAAESAGFFPLGEEAGALGGVAHGGAAAGGRPDGGDEGAGAQSFGGELPGEAGEIVVGGIDVGVRQGEEEIDAIEARAIHPRGGGEIEHGIEIDGRFGIGTFSDEPGPHGVVQGREGVRSGSVHGYPPWREARIGSGLKRLKRC